MYGMSMLDSRGPPVRAGVEAELLRLPCEPYSARRGIQMPILSSPELDIVLGLEVARKMLSGLSSPTNLPSSLSLLFDSASCLEEGAAGPPRSLRRSVLKSVHKALVWFSAGPSCSKGGRLGGTEETVVEL